MRKTIRLTIILLVVAIIYFGYSAWIDAVAIYNVNAVQVGASSSWNSQFQEIWAQLDQTARETLIQSWSKFNIPGVAHTAKVSDLFSLEGLSNIDFIRAVIEKSNTVGPKTYQLKGFMGANSLLKTLLDPFKLILVGGVFAMFIPLTKQLLFGTFIGMKSYIKNRQSNVLYNYEKTIAYVEDLKIQLTKGSLKEVKASYANFAGLSFKPEFLNHMMDEICTILISEGDLKVFVDPSQTVIDSLKEMYDKERRRAITGRGDELFFDLKRSYEYCAKGSKYSLAYYKSQQSQVDNSLGWKIYSLEIFKFNIYLLVALIPSLVITGIIGSIINWLIPASTNADLRVLTYALTFFVPWVLMAIVLHAHFIFRNKEYQMIKRVLWEPAVVYYTLYLLTFITIAAGVVGLVKVGNIANPNTGTQIWVWFSALAYLVLSTSLIFYVLATLVDSFKTFHNLKRKYLIDGVVIPAIAWLVATVANFLALYGNINSNFANLHNLFATINTLVLIGTWIYLLISSFLLNNIILPNTSRNLRLALEAEALGKQTKQPSKSSAKN